MLGPSATTLSKLGAKVTPLILENGEWHRLFSAMFLHGGVIHLGCNMSALWKEGGTLEKVWGWRPIFLIYILGGVSGNLVSSIFLPSSITVGASGAVFALFGAFWAEFIQNITQYPSCYEMLKSFSWLLISTAVNLAIGLMPMVDNFAHVGGFIAGVFGGLVFLLREDDSGEYSLAQKCCGSMAFIALVSLLLCEFLVLYLEVDPSAWCTFCEYINCVETDYWECDADSMGNCAAGRTLEMGGVEVTCLDGMVKIAPNATVFSQNDLKDVCLQLCSH